MARPMRIAFEGALCYVTVRGNERKPIVRDDPDRQHFLQDLRQSVSDYAIRLHIFCLMENHYHPLDLMEGPAPQQRERYRQYVEAGLTETDQELASAFATKIL
jgi:REP element-mobilizing transposase RayT